jgi:probable HAF family extracellular repeat protein
MVIIVVLALLSIASPLFAQQYTMIDLGSWAEPKAVNAQGEIAGTCLSETRNDDPCFWTNDGSRHNIGIFPECFRGYATALNDLGQVVGFCETLGDSAPAFIWTADQGRVRLPTPDGTSAWVIRPAGINDSGVIVGWLREANGGPGHGFVYDGGTYTFLDTSRNAWGINDNRQIVGANSSQAVTWDDGGAHVLPVFDPSDFSSAFAIDGGGGLIVGVDGFHAAAWTVYGIMDLGTMCPNPDASGTFALARATAGGLIVGWSSCPEYESTAQHHAFVYDVNGPGYGFDLNGLVALPPAWTLEAAYGVNAAGQIVGTALDNDHNRHGFVLTPGGAVTTLTGKNTFAVPFY